jgi:hypothetical protein
MRFHFVNHKIKTVLYVTLVLLLGAGLAVAQQQVNLSAGASFLVLPDGTNLPMWGYSCGAAAASSTASCAPLSKVAGWSPVVITLPTGQDLQINLTNNLSFPTTGSPNNIPTSLVIVGQVGAGLGDATQRSTSSSPSHVAQPTTWPIANTGAMFAPPPQGPRVRSFSTEVAAGATTSLTWTGLQPGTYLLESGTHPSIQGPMGLYGIVVVTTAPSGATPGTAYPNVTYNAEIPLLFSEVDPLQNNAVQAAVNTAGFNENATNTLFLKPGPIQGLNLSNGGTGYTSAPSVVITGGGGSGATATAQIDTDSTSTTYQQVIGLTLTSPGSGFTSEPTILISGGAGNGATAYASLTGIGNAMSQCSGSATACYPPAVNYTPLYYLINGTAFNKTNGANSLFSATAGVDGNNLPVTTGISGNVLVRLVNAGLRMHVPSIVGSQTTQPVAGTPTTYSGFSLIAEDGNPLPGVPRVQSEVFLAAGKTYDVMINAPTSITALPIFDRELSLSAASTNRDGGMLAYISVNGSGLPSAGVLTTAMASPDDYKSVVAGQTLTVSDPSKGVIANDVNIFAVKSMTLPTQGALTLNPNGTFTYVANSNWSGTDSFMYCGNGATSGPACATVKLEASAIASSTITCSGGTLSANTASYFSAKTPGLLAGCTDSNHLPLTIDTATVSASGMTLLTADVNGGFAVTSTGASGTISFQAKNSLGAHSNTATVTVNFPAGSKLAVTVIDGADKTTKIADYRWIIEEDRTFYINPNNTTNNGTSIVPTFGTNFHTSYMPVVATGCTGPLSCEGGQTMVDNRPACTSPGVPAGCSATSGQHIPVVCDLGNGACRFDASGQGQPVIMPGDVPLDPNKRYYISVLPGDAANPFIGGNTSAPTNCSAGPYNSDGSLNTNCGHGMGGAPISFGQNSVTIFTQPSPFPPAKLSVFVFEDDFPLNGEQDGGGGIDVLSPNEPGLGEFQITLFDDAGGTGDATGQPTYDMFNMPLSNSLAGTIDPATGLDSCPISKNATTAQGVTGQLGITGMIVTCPKYESDGATLSPLAGQAVVANLYAGRYGVVATPGADRIARGEEWLQTNTLDGQKAHDSFLRIGEPSFFQEFGPAGYHVSIGFANPAIINARKTFVCNGTDANITGNCSPGNTVTGLVTTERMSRTPDERLYSSGSNDSFAFTQCFVSFGDADGEDFAFTKCNGDGTFTLSGLPDGDWRITVFDQWNDMLVDGLSTPVRLGDANSLCPGKGSTQHSCNMGDIAMNQWQANIYTRTFLDLNGDGVSNKDANGNDAEPGLALVPTNIRFRDGSYSNFNNTDLFGYAGFNEVFPLFSWYVIETDNTRYKNTGTHVVYDTGGPADGSLSCNNSAQCGNSTIAGYMANTFEQTSLPIPLRVPGAVYCSGADCGGHSIAAGAASSDPPSSCTTDAKGVVTCASTLSTGRIDPPWVVSEGWQGFSGQNSFIEFGKAPYAPGENGGIRGHVIYASTRPFDDPQLLLQTSWEPLVPGVTINLYQEGFAADGVTPTLTLVDTTKTSSFDDWAQGFRSDGVPNMNCPGQLPPGSSPGQDIFGFTLYNQPMWLDVYNHGGTAENTVPNNSQFKCYDGMHNWNQVQPAPYDGMYQFPSVTSLDPLTGKPTGTNCHSWTNAEPWGCVPNPTSSNPNDPTYDPYRAGTPMLAAGKYVVEVVIPPGYELVKEEDKNILIGDNFIAPVTQEFAGLGNIFILPDQAELATEYNSSNPQNPTQGLGRTTFPSQEGDTGSVETYWPCVGEQRTVPDFISLFPGSAEVSPFAGAVRNLCDRKEVTLGNQMSALAKFYIFTSTHAAAHFTGVITDDYTSEFDPFSPQFGEKFSPPNMPISIKDWTGQEISRVYADQWGTYNGLNYSTWEVNPPNPTGYAPTMMVVCMNDPGTGPKPDPLYNPQYSQFCYEIPFMPGQTQYMDTPVVPTSAYAGAGYNNPDCAYPDNTPAISSVTGDVAGPWVSASGHTLTINSLPDLQVPNFGYSGPSATASPFNAKTINRHYGFGSAKGIVTIGTDSNGNPVPATVTNWSDTQITVTVPATGNGAAQVPACTIQQQAQYSGGAGTAYCGELIITAANGKQSIDTVTITIGGRHPTVMAAGQTIQSAIDAASPGDMIIVPAGEYDEMILMWKPVRLQGVGAASTVINANTHPAGKMDVWRRRVNCLFGLALNGTPISGTNPYDDPKDTANNGGPFTCPANQDLAVDRLPLEAAVGWDATQNGNLAELLQEPTLMGALEGAGITVLGKGVNFHGQDPWTDGNETGGFPVGSTLLLGTVNSQGNGSVGDANSLCHTVNDRGRIISQTNEFPSNFACNPSRIDGLSVTDSSQGGGGIYAHGWNHYLEISNNRINSNAGTLSGGVNVGQGEFPGAYILGSGTNAAPDSCRTSGLVPGQQQPYCFDYKVYVHNNAITNNSSTGDELFSATPAGAGGVSVCNGSDYYRFNYNWVCGNLSTGDGGGLAHIGFSFNGDIEHNTFAFNQSTNPTIPTNGGGVNIMGAPDVDPTCGGTTDQDCLNPTPVGPSDGTGPGLVINANLFQGNTAESGSGGGIALQHVNGSEVVAFPRTPTRWNSVTLTNNIITNNVAGWDGGGVSLLDALNVSLINNTIASNDTTASAGPLFNTIGAPLASSQGPCPVARNTDGTCPVAVTTSTPQPAGLVSLPNSSNLMGSLPATITCPTNRGPGGTGTGGLNNGACRYFSYPELYNNVLWENRVFYIGVGGLGNGTVNQQNIVTLYNGFTTNIVTNESQSDATTPNPNGGVTISGGTGACVDGSQYWDIGVRGDTGPSNHSGSAWTNHAPVPLAPTYSVLTDAGDYPNLHNTNSNPSVVSQYCNGSRVPPELGSVGWQVPPGISDATVPNPIFNLMPAATVDEGNNWINLSWGPLALTNPSVQGTDGNYGGGSLLGNYGPATANSPVVNYIPDSGAGVTFYNAAPTLDYYGTPRKTNGFVDAGAVEYQVPAIAVLNVTPTSLTFSNVVQGTTSAAQTLTLHNTGGAQATGISVTVTPPFSRSGGSCGGTLNAGANCTMNIVYAPSTTSTGDAGSVTISANVAVSGSPVSLTGTTVARVVSASLTPASWSPTANRGCTLFGANACPVQAFTLTNTGNVPLTGIGQGSVSGAGEFTVTRLASTCGPAGGGQLLGLTTLNPGAACTVTVRFAPPSGDTTGTKNASVSVTDAAGTQTSTLTGKAN